MRSGTGKTRKRRRQPKCAQSLHDPTYEVWMRVEDRKAFGILPLGKWGMKTWVFMVSKPRLPILGESLEG